MSTEKNLMDAFAGESQANRRYLAFAKKAETDGYPQVARLFRAAAEAETIHAHAHLRALKGIGTTVENLKAAVAGEAHEFKEMYPGFVRDAEREKHQAGLVSCRNAMMVEQTHHDLYAKALQSVEGGKDLPSAAIYVCPICGHTEVGTAPERCPVCKATRDRFFEVQ